MPKTTFRPQTDGFLFANRWKFEGDELAQITNYFVGASSNVGAMLGNTFGGWVTSAAGLVTRALNNPNMDFSAYGLCGGMAYAARDYYDLGLVLPRGANPGDVPSGLPGSPAATLRTYIFQRLLDSLGDGDVGSKLLLWMAALHFVPHIFGGGPAWTLARSREEWQALKGHLNTGKPWPITLIGSSAVPSNQHQVLAYGYEDPGDGTGTLYLYDPNCPSDTTSGQTIQLDFRGTGLQAVESCAMADRGPLQGFFCADYHAPKTPPPIAVGLTSAPATSALNTATGATVQLSFQTKNLSYAPTPPLTLGVVTPQLARQSLLPGSGHEPTVTAAASEAHPTPIAPGSERTFDATAQLSPTTPADQLTPMCFLGTFDGFDVWKRLPIV